MKFAIIGGTGFEEIAGDIREMTIDTKYGSVSYDIVKIDEVEFIFLSRHNKDHSLAPHLINYRANISALKDLGVHYIFGICAVGSCNSMYFPGDIVILKDFIDFTKSRVNTFYDGIEYPLKHIDMSSPYSEGLSALFIDHIKKFNIRYHRGIYLCTEGPRFETASEIKFYASIGADVVGMTNVPEVVLARELGMNYCGISYVTNLCTGLDINNKVVNIDVDMTVIRDNILSTIACVLKDKRIMDIEEGEVFI